MREPKMCQIVCKATISDKQAKELKEKIEDEYRVNMYACMDCLVWLKFILYDGFWSNMVKLPYRILDNLPLVVPITRPDRDDVVFQGGYHVGVKGQYAGVSLCAQLTFSFVWKISNDLTKIYSAEQGWEVLYP